MAKKVTSKKVATKASKVLQDKRTSKNSKSAAGSALSQREKPKRKKDKQKHIVAFFSYRFLTGQFGNLNIL